MRELDGATTSDGFCGVTGFDKSLDMVATAVSGGTRNNRSTKTNTQSTYERLIRRKVKAHRYKFQRELNESEKG